MNKDGGNDESGIVLTIQDVGYRGRGVGRDEGQVIFVPGVIAGERVRVRVTHRHKRFCDAQLVEILEPAPDRVAPVCPLALRAATETGAPAFPCVACVYQHVAYDEEVRIKQRQLGALLQRVGGLHQSPLCDPVGSPDALGYRNKIRLHGGRYQGRRVLGYVGANNHSVLDVPRCPLACDAINERLSELRGEAGWLEGLRGSAEVVLRWTPTDGVLESIRGEKRMKGDLTERSALGDLTVPAPTFYQVNVAVANRLIEAVQGVVADSECGHVLDLYCGVGCFGLAAARLGRAVWGVDQDKRAVRCANGNAIRLGVESLCNVAAASVERAASEMLARAPRDDTLAIVDPPRFGLDKSVREAFVAAPPRQLIYVSCAPDTLARDLKRLGEAGYAVEQIQMFDMFPRTACFETLVVLTRQEN